MTAGENTKPAGARKRTATDAEQVVDYLRRHPDFLEHNPELFALLTLPHRRLGDGSTDVVDLQRAMLDRLRREISQLQAQRGELLATTRSNLQTQTRIHAAVLALLSAPSFEQLLETVSTDLAVLLDVDIVVIGADEQALGDIKASGVRRLPEGLVDELLGERGDVLLRDDISGDERLYGSGAGLVRSEALLRLEIGPGCAVVAFGSRAPDAFRGGQGTELIAFLASTLEHSMRAWLELPA